MKRVMIIGQPGSGKSTLAIKLGERVGLPVYHMDQIHWQSGWVEREKGEKNRMSRELHAKDEWIFEGGNSETWGERLSRADSLIWLDFSFGHRMWRVTRRMVLGYGRNRPDLPDGCPERFNWAFYKWCWDTRKTMRRHMLDFYQNAPNEKVKLHFKSLRQVEHYLFELCEE